MSAMTDTRNSPSAPDPNRVPRPALIAAGALILFSLALTATVQWGNLPHSGRPDPGVQILQSRELRFQDAEGGRIAVVAAGGETVAYLTPEQGGFARAVLKGMARDRAGAKASAETPFRLTYWDDGRLTLDDPVTGGSVVLSAFGIDNAKVFAALLDIEGDGE